MSKREILLSDINPDTIDEDQDLSFNKESRKRNKYGAQPVRDITYGRFDSTGEYRYFLSLVAREEAGEISNLSRQPRFILVPNGTVMLDGEQRIIKSIAFTADFKYFDNTYRHWVVVEWKGHMTRDARLRLILFLNTFPDFELSMPNGGLQYLVRTSRERRRKTGKKAQDDSD